MDKPAAANGDIANQTANSDAAAASSSSILVARPIATCDNWTVRSATPSPSSSPPRTAASAAAGNKGKKGIFANGKDHKQNDNHNDNHVPMEVDAPDHAVGVGAREVDVRAAATQHKQTAVKTEARPAPSKVAPAEPVRLEDILDGGVEQLHTGNSDEDGDSSSAESHDAEPVQGGSGSRNGGNKKKKPAPAPQGYCVECEDQPAVVFCEQCADDYCDVCFHSQHRKGNRKKHTSKALVTPVSQKKQKRGKSGRSTPEETATTTEGVAGADDWKLLEAQPTGKRPVGDWFLERSKYIPVRLSLEERKFLRLLEAGLSVSEYTDKIDILTYGNKSKRIVAQIKELCAILSGLVLAADYKVGQDLFQDRDFENNKAFFQEIFELGRRHKIMNPEKMRATYGKLVYMLQDSQIPEVREMLQFACVKPVKTVYTLLSSTKNGLALLQDDLISIATQEITSDGRSRHQVQADIKLKERAIEQLARKYAANDLKPDQIRQCLYSIGDNHAFLRVNRDPCDKMIEYLQTYFREDAMEDKFSLAIRAGRGGARLSHDHSKQYHYVLQSLTLWREIMHDMFMVWSLAEQDLLAEGNMYRLRDTGQGLNRVQAAPKVSRIMHTILHRAQKKVGYWVGSSVIHLGDHNVPNALMFIDKYTQIYRILLPIVNCLSQIAAVRERDAGIRAYVDGEFGGTEMLVKTILADFFRHAFDGSGADNFFDAGSCIDGRLTSAWNWCSTLEKKKYFPIFLLTGFVGFDGQW
uniref:uncharacterized protein n=1 Tax=Fimicolochytrium jonesii TaxID=1396493 RepID=UPI0022FEA170|nr:uncharacterized protein EV422DRAFT_529271 [Fimicolochytrium jonesii]KAI8821128.1 hypothetical protein EV422DRAFT_529271 [Fimicolochytrium jonesii]